MNIYSSNLIEQYNDSINDISGEVSVYGMSWDASYVLEQMDPTAYRIGFYDYLDMIGIDSDSDDIIWDQSI